MEHEADHFIAVRTRMMWPSILAIILSCCGVPALIPLAAVLFEKTPPSAALPGPTQG